MWRSAVVFCGFIDAGENAEVKRLGVYKKILAINMDKISRL